MVLSKNWMKNNRKSAFFGHPDLPVTQVLPQLTAALDQPGTAVLQAPPGSGKTTRVPLALLDAPWLAGKKILMLEPRRLAARTCACFMAGLINEPVGRTVGYRIRMETKIGRHTRIEVVTEAILTRMIQNDPALEEVGLVIFDEFHERHIHSDLGLALCLESADALRPDLRILVMSATMDTTALAALLNPAQVIVSRGRQWPVQTVYLPPVFGRSGPGRFTPVLAGCVTAVLTALANYSGDILVFLPGAAEIRHTARMLAQKTGPDVQVFPLSGLLSFEKQRAALVPSPPGYRKVVLATAIAETSLTIEGIQIVVDSGLMRKPVFFPGTELTRLQTMPVSRASADQRRGRAGRTGPGICFRIWSEHVHKGLVPFTRPEIVEQDLAGVALELALWGVRDPGDLKWLDLPPDRAFSRARDLLLRLGCLDDQGNITPHGKAIAGSGIHPRLAHMIRKADRQGNGFLACCLAVLLEEKEMIPGSSHDPDIRTRLELLAAMHQNPVKNKMAKETRVRARNILTASRRLARKMEIRQRALDPEKAGITLSLGFPERVAGRRGPLSYTMASGSGAYFKEPNTVAVHDYILAAHVEGHPKNALIFLAAPVPVQELEQVWGDQMDTRDVVEWDPDKQAVQAMRRTWYGRILIRQVPVPDPDHEAVRAAMIQGIRLMGPASLPWTRKLLHFCHRVCFLREQAGLSHLPDLSDPGLLERLPFWLGPFLTRVRSARDLKQVDLTGALMSLFSWDDRQMVDDQAPSHITVPSGSRIPVSYTDGNQILASPVLAVRLQELFGMTRTPTVANNKIAVTLHLLSPAGRPVQVTQDLASFWKNTYKDVKKDLMGRYPRHFWPDDPMSATPTCRAKPKK
ncbi:MAG: ATP-dependent helicase HrpB [Desulfotignum sp.]|nr:ATP-dependent helicase HrpB [Desulfotignum sp.]